MLITKKGTTNPLRKQEKKTKGSFFDLVIVVLGTIFVISWLIGYITIRREDRNANVPNAQESIRVEVLNGCGVAGIASDFANFLRSAGIDVLAPENAASFGFPETIILDRTGNRTEADSLVKLLGLPSDKVILQRKDGIVDATLIIGKDFDRYRLN
ncbi:LytR C-terminal domain-containing protein [bacterium]|nr:LytR C-terminal domain-containing protein [bacterium]